VRACVFTVGDESMAYYDPDCYNIVTKLPHHRIVLDIEFNST
jgi:hypothetical protein